VPTSARESGKYEQFALYDDMLFNLISVGSNDPLRWVQCLPSSCRARVLEECHGAPTSGHGGTYKTFHRVRQHYYWPKMNDDVKSYVQSCQVCQAQKIERKKPPGLMGATPKVPKPFEMPCSDLIGPLPRSTKGNTCLLVCVEYFSKYVYVKALRDTKAKKVVDFIENEIFLVHGAPRTILVDNGRQYVSNEFKNLCARYDVDVRYNIPRTPRNNPTERYNQTLETMMRTYVGDRQKD